MNPYRIGLAVVSLFVAAAFCQAQETYTIKLKESAQGDIFKVKSAESKKSVTVVKDSKGQALKEIPQLEAKSYLYTVTIEEKEAGQKEPTVVSQAFDKAVITTDGKARISSLEGNTVRMEKSGARFIYRFADGTKLAPEQIADLDHDPGKNDSEVTDRDFMPKKPVKLNETWSVDATAIAAKEKEATQTFDMSSAKITGKLVRVYQKDGRQFGVLEMEFVLPVRKGLENGGFKVQSGQMVMKITMDTCIDGSAGVKSSKGSMAMDMRGTGEFQGEQFSATVQMTGTMEETREEVRKK